SGVISIGAGGAKPKENPTSEVLVWTTVLMLTYKRQPCQRAEGKYQVDGFLVDSKREAPYSCRRLGYEGATPEGAKLNQTPLKFEAHLLSPNSPRKFDSTLMPSVRLGIPICLNSASQAALVMKQTTTK
ncbi:hypothetical protein Tco_0928666, partial [Tanacetum coccineum]